MKVIYLCGSTPVCMLPTHHVTTKGLFHLVTNFELEEGSNTSSLSPGEICHSVAEALLTFLGLEHIFQWQPSQLCAALSKVQDVLNLIFYWPRICHFSGTPFHKQCLVLCCHPTTPEPPAAVFLGKAQAIQNVPSDVSKGPRRGWRQAHSAVGHCHALKWLGWSPGITVGCRPPHPVRRHCQQRRGRWHGDPNQHLRLVLGLVLKSVQLLPLPLLAPCVWPPASTQAIEPAVQAMGLTWPPRSQQSHKPHLCHDLVPL